MSARFCMACFRRQRHGHCISCYRSIPEGQLLCNRGCALPDPERVKELQESGETSAQRRRRWEREARGP